jgi:hypothetical protein
MRQSDYRQIIEAAKERIQRVLPDAQALSAQEAAAIAMTCASVVDTYFLPWLRNSAASAASAEARRLLTENLEVEETEDHQGLLRSFVSPIANRATALTHVRVKNAAMQLRPVNDRITELTAIAPCGVHLLSLIENTTPIFYNWMYPGIADKFPEADRTYLDVHTVADPVHGSIMLEAFDFECRHVSWRPEVDEMTELAMQMLEGIFTAHQVPAALAAE